MTGLGQCHMEWDDLIHERPISFEIQESVNTDNNKHTYYQVQVQTKLNVSWSFSCRYSEFR